MILHYVLQHDMEYETGKVFQDLTLTISHSNSFDGQTLSNLMIRYEYDQGPCIKSCRLSK
jgi:hypothetical protein